MDSKINVSIPEKLQFEFCEHLKSQSFNSFLDNQQSNSSLKNLFHLNNHSSYISNLSSRELKTFFDKYFIKNMGLEWIALHNPNNSSQSSINREGCIFTLDFDEHGRTLAASNHNHHIEVWDMGKKKMKKLIRDHKEIVTGLQFFKRDSSHMMSCSLDKTIKLWKDFKCVHTFLDHSDWVRCLSVSDSNRNFLSGCVSSVIKLWDLEKQIVTSSIVNANPDPDHMNTVNSLSFFNDDKMFLCGLRDGIVKVFDIRTNLSSPNITNEFKAHKLKLNSIKTNHNNTYLLSSGRDSVARLWDFRKLPVRRI